MSTVSNDGNIYGGCINNIYFISGSKVLGHYTLDITNPSATFDLKYTSRSVDSYCLDSYITSAGVFRMFYYYLSGGNQDLYYYQIADAFTGTTAEVYRVSFGFTYTAPIKFG